MYQKRVSRDSVFVQSLLGLGAYIMLSLPYVRRVHGLEKLQPRGRYLFVANHVSLLDTIMLGGLFWRSARYPILVLGDKDTWHASWIKKALSDRIGFLIERKKFKLERIRELKEFARAGERFHLVVFPEGTRGDGINVASLRPGLHFIAQEARLPMVPVFIENMQFLSTKTGRFHPLGGLQKVEVHFGEAIAPDKYLTMPREEFLEFVRRSITMAPQWQRTAHLSPAPQQV